jgi:hypothetical protein
MTPETATAPPSGAAEPEPQMVRWLKFAVVAMGIMIVVGLLVIIGRIVYLASNGPKQAMSAASGGRMTAATSVAVPAGSSVRQISLSGDRLAVHYEGPAGTGIAIVDLASGTVLSRIQVVPEVPR